MVTATTRRRSRCRGSAAATSGQRPFPVMTRQDGARTGSMRKWRTWDCGARGERSEGADNGARARRLRPWRCVQECSIEPYRSEQDDAVACLGERGRWRSVACGQSSEGGLPAVERGGGGGAVLTSRSSFSK
jgi:hypothetical protein